MNDVRMAKLRVLERAVKLLGRDELARCLNIPTTLVDSWIKGDATMGDTQLLNLSRALDRISRRQGGG
jgi:hypothetical protein